jgi:hypothetical protein
MSRSRSFLLSSVLMPSVAAVLAVAAVGCGEAASTDSVDNGALYGGQGETERIGVVEVKTTVPGATYKHECTGIVLTTGVILTAAHCVSEWIPDPAETSAALAMVRYKKGGAYRCISGPTTPGGDCAQWSDVRVYMNSNFHDGDADTDIAKVMAVAQPYDVGPDDMAEIYEDSMRYTSRLEAFGYGANTFGGAGIGVLRSGTFAVDWYGSDHFILIDKGARLCAGDSGGPAMVYRTQSGDGEAQAVGLVSNGSTTPSGFCGAYNGQERLIRLSAQMEWIRSGPYYQLDCQPTISPANGRRVERCH